MEWSYIKASEFCDSVRDGTHDTPKQTEQGYKLVTGKHIKNGIIDPADAYCISEKDYKKINERSRVEQWDVLMSMIGTVGEVAVVQDKPEYAIKNVALFKCGGSESKGRWLSYYLKSPKAIGHMTGNQKGSSQQFLSLKQLRELPIAVTDEETMGKIINKLLSFDKMIENHQKQIKLLEEAAQRLYKEWFVDLRFPGYEDVHIVDGVPEGWRKCVISDICDTVGGGTPSTSRREYYDGGTIPWVTPTDLTKDGSLILLDTEKHITEDGLNNSSAKIVPSNTILMTSRASIGYFALCEQEVCTNQGFISCIPKHEYIRYYLLYNLMNRVEEIKGKATGSTFLEIAKRTFRDMGILIPSDYIIQGFSSYITPYIERMRTIRKQINYLDEARDRLLPKLMSGEIEL